MCRTVKEKGMVKVVQHKEQLQELFKAGPQPGLALPLGPSLQQSRNRIF